MKAVARGAVEEHPRAAIIKPIQSEFRCGAFLKMRRIYFLDSYVYSLDGWVLIRYSFGSACLIRKQIILIMYEFDKIDIKIVNLLLEDGRMSASEIARRIGDISERAVRYHIDRMVQEGVIQVTAVVKPEAFGLTIKADIWLEVESGQIMEVAKKLTTFDSVTYVACGIGQNDISIQVVSKDTAEVYHFVTEVVRKIPGVRKTTTSIVPVILKDVYQWRVPESATKDSNETLPSTD